MSLNSEGYWGFHLICRRQLGKIKYLKDDENDCDLDPEATVQDLLINEGKAEVDTSDQHVTIKVVQEHGRAIREGSVVPDLTPIQYQSRILPPVPRFPQSETVLGKRWATSPMGAVPNGITKKARLDDMQEALEQDIPIASVESDSHHVRPYQAEFVNDSIAQPSAGTYQQASIPSGYPQEQAYNGSHHSHPPSAPPAILRAGKSQAPTTPSSAQSSKAPASKQHLQADVTAPARSPFESNSASSLRRFKQVGTAAHESEIDDSQMSPRSRSDQLRSNVSLLRSSPSTSPSKRRQNADAPIEVTATPLVNGQQHETSASETDHSSAGQSDSGEEKGDEKNELEDFDHQPAALNAALSNDVEEATLTPEARGEAAADNSNHQPLPEASTDASVQSPPPQPQTSATKNATNTARAL